MVSQGVTLELVEVESRLASWVEPVLERAEVRTVAEVRGLCTRKEFEYWRVTEDKHRMGKVAEMSCQMIAGLLAFEVASW